MAPGEQNMRASFPKDKLEFSIPDIIQGVYKLLCTCGSVLLIVAIYLASGDIAIAAQPSECASNIV